MTVQPQETTNTARIAELPQLPADGRILSIDPGTAKHGLAVSDEMGITARGLKRLAAASWKSTLLSVRKLIEQFDAKALIIGLPLESDGSESEMSIKARDMARKFALSLEIPVYLQDERVSSYEARRRLWASGVRAENVRGSVDSEAASVILGDFLDRIAKLRAEA